MTTTVQIVDNAGASVVEVSTPGPQGVTGGPGPAGAAVVGPQGVPGVDGASAYQTAIASGFIGTEAAWLASLVGPQGVPGVDGAAGPGGVDGSSAYQVAVAAGFVGTEAAWLASLVGPQGPAGSGGGGLPAYEAWMEPYSSEGLALTAYPDGAGGLGYYLDVAPPVTPSDGVLGSYLKVSQENPLMLDWADPVGFQPFPVVGLDRSPDGAGGMAGAGVQLSYIGSGAAGNFDGASTLGSRLHTRLTAAEVPATPALVGTTSSPCVTIGADPLVDFTIAIPDAIDTFFFFGLASDPAGLQANTAAAYNAVFRNLLGLGHAPGAANQNLHIAFATGDVFGASDMGINFPVAAGEVYRFVAHRGDTGGARLAHTIDVYRLGTAFVYRGGVGFNNLPDAATPLSFTAFRKAKNTVDGQGTLGLGLLGVTVRSK